MKKKLDELYEEYLKEKLDLIFNSKTGTIQENGINKAFNSKFENNYARISNNEKYNFIDTKEELISKKWYDMIDNFTEGYAVVKKKGKYNFIDTTGQLISVVWYDYAGDYREGYARVLNNEKYNFIDTKGQLVSKKWYDDVWCFTDGYAIVNNNEKYNFIDTKGQLIGKEWYDDVWDFSDGHAIVRKNGQYNIIDTTGQLVSEEWYEGIGSFKEGYAKVKNYGKYNFIDTKGQLVSKKWKKECTRISGKFIYFGDNLICTEIDMQDYHVIKTLTGYACNNNQDKFKVKYMPIKMYGLRYVLCLDKENLYLFDRKQNSYQKIGTIRTIEYDNNFIFDKDKDILNLIYDDKKINVTNYYKENLNNKDIYITRGINLLTKDDFFYKNEDEIIKLLEEEKKKNQKIKEEYEKERQEKELEQAKKDEENKEKERQEKEKQLLSQLKDLLVELKEVSIKSNSHPRIHFDDIFIEVQDHKEINVHLREILKFVDLSYINFDNVKIEGIDFRGSNITFNPQNIFNKDLSNCNFEGIYINPFMDFRGVNIKGARFSDDNNPKTLDVFNPSLQYAIYDANTTYNGISFEEIFGKNIKTQ